jgi:hypothetical protein
MTKSTAFWDMTSCSFVEIGLLSWRPCVPPICPRSCNKLHGVTYQKIVLFNAWIPLPPPPKKISSKWFPEPCRTLASCCLTIWAAFKSESLRLGRMARLLSFSVRRGTFVIKCLGMEQCNKTRWKCFHAAYTRGRNKQQKRHEKDVQNGERRKRPGR